MAHGLSGHFGGRPIDIRRTTFSSRLPHKPQYRLGILHRTKRPPCLPPRAGVSRASRRKRSMRRRIVELQRKPSWHVLTSRRCQSLVISARLRYGPDRTKLAIHVEGSNLMKRILLAAIGILAPITFAATTANAQAVRNYNCTKAGNANKAVCKNAAAAPKPVATRNYDCSKAGNANKAVCKGAVIAPPAAPASTAMPRNYDCSKAGNANKAVCKGAAAPIAPAPRAVPPPASRPVPRAAPAPRAPVTGQNTNPSGPNGATAKCRDGTMSFSAHRSGTCSRHGGVAQWF